MTMGEEQSKEGAGATRVPAPQVAGGAEDRRVSLARRIFLAMSLVGLACCLIVTVASALVYQRSLLEDAEASLAHECTALASALDVSAETSDEEVEILSNEDFGDARVTLLDSDGTVLYDSFANASTLPNHADRPEVSEALESGEGSSVRDSETAGYVSIYQAVRLESGRVLRLSVDRAGIMHVLWDDAWFMAVIALMVVGVSWLTSHLLSRRLVRPILAIDPTSGGATSPYSELDPLVKRLNEQNEELLARMDQIKDADAMRQEFTANVTHELKTPIASISGASELIRDGIARPEDVEDFAGRIYDDAQRLSSLVSDLLTLSKLDESERMGDNALFGEEETVDLLEVAQDVAERLSSKARAYNVMLKVQGTHTQVAGHPRLIDEMVRNLCDNAIRYNRTGGSVHVFVLPVDGCPSIRVSDTGVGISDKDQAKVFERFYRVDKSRSRASGGTGLGLAIVKHAATLHGARIDLESELGKGTDITVTFPRESAR